MSEEVRCFGVRIKAGIVSVWNDQPMLSYEEAERCRDWIMDTTGEEGIVERVYVVAQHWRVDEEKTPE